MTKKRETRVGLWSFNRRQRITGVLAAILLAAQCGLLIWGRHAGKGWDEVWPSGLAALAMVLLLVSTVRGARGDDPAGNLPRSSGGAAQQAAAADARWRGRS
jgi:hypothetical protein